MGATIKSMKKEMGITNKNDGIMGGSYGGFMTSWIISHHPNMFKSAIVERALLNWETMVGTSDIGIGFPEMYLLNDMDKNKPQNLINFNVGNEFAVNLFKKRIIKYTDIYKIIKKVTHLNLYSSVNTIKDILNYHEEVEEKLQNFILKL